MDLAAIQSALRECNIDAWLFYDHHHRDPIAYRVLGLPTSLMVTRRWFYLVPAEGEPIKLVHKIEAGHLDSLPGKKHQYSGWQELFDQLKAILSRHRDLAMQYSPNNSVFTISLVDGGTIDLLRGLGKNIVSSADLVAQFESTWTEAQIQSHFAARDSIDSIVAASFKEIGKRVRNGGTKEHEIQQWFMEAFARENLSTDDPPIVAVNANAGNPHYEPHSSHPVAIREGDLVLLDVWGKKNTPGAVYYDITWMGFVGAAPSGRMQEVFEIVRDARDAGVKTVLDAINSGRRIAGWEVDRALTPVRSQRHEIQTASANVTDETKDIENIAAVRLVDTALHREAEHKKSRNRYEQQQAASPALLNHVPRARNQPAYGRGDHRHHADGFLLRPGLIDHFF